MRTICWMALAMVTLAGCAPRGWQADPTIVKKLSERRPDVNYVEARVPRSKLPDPLRTADGTKVKTARQWESRRAELLELFTTQMFGRSPGKPQELRFETIAEEAKAMNGAATMRRIEIRSTQNGREHVFELDLFIPNAATGPAPVLLLIDNRGGATTSPVRGATSDFWPAEQILARGYATATFHTSSVAPDNAEHFRDGIINTLEGGATTRPADAWGAIAAWAWGASRAMDYLAGEPRIDPKHVAVIGHSRGGKTALWAAAQDARFAMVYANASGCGGSSLARRRFGETLKLINDRFPHWFCGNYKAYNDLENELPFDAHELVALIAPRPVYFAAASEDLWADPRGSFLTLAKASPVYGLWSIRRFPDGPMPALGDQLIAGNRGWHMHAGKHDLTPFDWAKFMDFADAMWTHTAPSKPGG